MSRLPRVLVQSSSSSFRNGLGNGLSSSLSSSARPRPIPVRPGFVTPRRSLPSTIFCPEYHSTGKPVSVTNIQILTDNDDIRRVRAAGRMARRILDFACSVAKPGMTTEEVDILCHNEMVRLDVCPSPLNYCGFPKAICTSVNDVVCHGIPDDRVLLEGDVLSIDVSVFLGGFHGDNCGTIIVGSEKNADQVAIDLVNTTRNALDAAVAICKPGSCLSAIGDTIQTIANKANFNVVHEFCGHGVGRHLHMPPYVMHHRNTNRLPLQRGMVITIEPILVEGSRKIFICDDDWTAATFDGGRGAQFEHQILITNDGVEVLTIPE